MLTPKLPALTPKLRAVGRKMPVQKPGKSKQDYATPDDFIAAVVDRFGPIDLDLAADEANAKSTVFYSERIDSLSDNAEWLVRDLTKDKWPPKPRGVMWLNPPFAHIDPWAEKCARSTIEKVFPQGQIILFLTPASVGSNWFFNHVHGIAHVIALSPRLSFDGQNPYPKDCILSVYGWGHGFSTWRWK